MEKVKEKVLAIIKKYDLKPIKLPEGHRNVYWYIREDEKRAKEFESEITDHELNLKYAKLIPRGWYGFDVGTPIVPDWMKIIKEVTEMCVSIDPNFEIHQVKLKYGRICYYVVSSIIEDTDEIDSILENNLYDVALIY